MSQAFLFGGALIGEAMARRAKAEVKTSPGFDRFWSAWPKHFRKVDRIKCFEKWHRVGLESIADDIVAAVGLWKRSDLWRKDNGQFIVAPLVWLNQGRWEVTIESFPELADQARASNPTKFKGGFQAFDS